MKFVPFIGLRYLTAKHHDKFINLVTFFSVGGILIGVAALIVVISIMNGFESEIRSKIIDTTSHITVYSYQRAGISNWESNIKRISEVPDVVAASPFAYAKGAIAGPEGTDGVLIRGIVPELEANTTNLPNQVYIGKFDLNDSNPTLPTTVLGRYLAEEIGARINDTISLFVLRRPGIILGPGSYTTKRFLVTGIFETELYDYDATLCYISLKSAQQLLGLGDKISGFQTKIKNFYNASSVAERLTEKLGLPFYAIPWSEINKTLFAWMTLEKWGMFLVLALIIAVAAFNIVSTLMMVVIEKTVDIGILKAMGASEKSIVKIFLFQGTVVGVIGTVLGVLLGSAMVLIQHNYKIISLPPDIYSISAVPMQLKLTDLLVVLILSSVLSILSAVYPAWRATKLNPVDAIRYR